MGKTPKILDTDAKIDTKANAEHLGYFNASMKNFDVYQLLHFMKTHGVHMKKSNDDPDDDWWFFLLPQGSTKARQEEYKGDVPRYRVQLPDGYSFTLEQGPLTREGYFTSPPHIFLDRLGEGEGHG